MNGKPSHECDSFLEPIELSKRDGDDQVASELLKTVLNEATHLVGAKAGYIRLLQNGKWATGATTASAAGYMEEISKLVPAPPLEVGKTMAAQAMVTEKPVVVGDVTSAELILPQTRKIAAAHGFYGAVVVPLFDCDRFVGILALFDDDIRIFTEDETSILVDMVACLRRH